MQVYYVGDNEGPVLLYLDELVGNFNDSHGWFSDPALGTFTEERMRDALDSVGWYAGIHENGRYLVLALKHLKLTLTPEAWDDPTIYPAGNTRTPGP